MNWLLKKNSIIYIIGLYEKNNVYQVCDEDDNILFQGTELACMDWKRLLEKGE